VKALVVCCDRLPTRLLGCYGSEWAETPTIDRLAARGIVFDEVYATSLNMGVFADEVVERLSPFSQEVVTRRLSDRTFRRDASSNWESPPPHVERGIDNVPLDRVLSDPYRRVPPIHHPAFKKWVDRWRRQLARDDQAEQTPDSCETLFATAAAAWDEESDVADLLLWVDVALAEADWVPPKNWRERHVTDADAPPPLVDPIPGVVGEIYSKDDVERVAAGWVNRLAYFDALLGALVQSIEESSDEPPLLIFTAEQGEPIGEHGVVGPHPQARHEERIHLPLVVVHSGGPQSARRKSLTTASDVAEMIVAAFREPERRATRPMDERWAIRCRLDSATALLTHRWKLIDDGDGVALYSRLEDFHDANELSMRSPTVVEELQAVLRNLDG
jgi:arylsulfatase A-like enzyme